MSRAIFSNANLPSIFLLLPGKVIGIYMILRKSIPAVKKKRKNKTETKLKRCNLKMTTKRNVVL